MSQTRAEYTNDLVVYDGVWVDARAYGSALNDTTIQAALTAIGSDSKVLVLTSGTWTIANNVNWSSYTNVVFKFMNGAVLTHTTKTINIPNIDAGDFQIFNGTGAVTLPNQNVRGYWFGMTGDGVTDNYAAFTKAVASTQEGAELQLGPGVFVFTAGTPTMDRGIHLKGSGSKWHAATATGAPQGTWLKQTGAGFDGLYVGPGAGLEIDGWKVSQLIVSSNTNGNNGIVLRGALRGHMEDVLVIGAKEAGIRTLAGTYLNLFTSVRVQNAAGSGLGQMKYGWYLTQGPNTYILCSGVGIVTGDGYGMYLNGESSSVFINPDVEGCNYGLYFAGGAAWNTFFNITVEASVIADVGGSTTNPSNLVFGVYNSTNSCNLGDGIGTTIMAQAATPTQAVERHLGRVIFSNGTTMPAFSATNPAGTVHIYRDGSDVVSADTLDDIPLSVEQTANTDNITALAIIARGATPDGQAKFGITGGNLSIQAKIMSGATMKRIILSPSGGGVRIGLAGVAVYANNAAAVAGGLVAGDLYRTNADPDPLCIVH